MTICRQATKTIKSIAEISQFILKKLRLMLSVKKNKAPLSPQAASDFHLPLAKITSTKGERSHLSKTSYSYVFETCGARPVDRDSGRQDLASCQ